MFEKFVAWIIKKLIKEKFAVWILKKLIAVLLKDWHLHRDPVRKQKEKEEGASNG